MPRVHHVYKMVQLATATNAKTCQISKEMGPRTFLKTIFLQEYISKVIFLQGPKLKYVIFAATNSIF